MQKSDGVIEKEIVFSGQQDTISDRVSGLVLKESLAVVDIEVIEEETTVYNFEVEDDHTYFVTDAEVWVHNAESYVVNKEKVSQEGLKAATQAYIDLKDGKISKSDYEAKIGTELPSTITGKVAVRESDTYGKHIYIDDGKGTKILYAHLSEINFTDGSNINKDQVIGKSGNTGYYNAKNKET